MRTLEDFIAQLQLKVEDLERETSIAFWNASISGSKEDEKKASALVAKLLLNYSSADDLHFLQQLDEPESEDLRRQRQLLINTFKANQSPPDVIADIASRELEIESLFANFRADLRGVSQSENMLRDVFKESDDSETRREAWEASKQIGSVVQEKLLQLVDIRNGEAHRRGYDNFYSMQIELQELNEAELFDQLSLVSQALKEPFTVAKAEIDSGLALRFGLPVDELMPWHYSNPFFQDAPENGAIDLDSYFAEKDLPEIAKQFFATIGFDIKRLIQNSDLYEKPGKNQHAYCAAMGRGTHDIRVLCNIAPNARWMATTLHEYGHAVYDDLIDDSLPFLLRQVTHTMTTEAIAELMGRFVNNGAWLKKYVGVVADEADAVDLACRATNRAHLLIFTQWVLVMSHFEREMYKNPKQDLNSLWWTLVEEFQQLRRPTGARGADWAAKIHISLSPVYYHNYLLGEMTASQILSAVKSSVAPTDDALVSTPKLGEWLTTNIFQSGARYGWNDLLQRATGERLNPTYFIDGIAT